MQCIRSVIKQTMVPSWVNSIPYNYGDASAGVLKANKWHNLGTIYFPIALGDQSLEGKSSWLCTEHSRISLCFGLHNVHCIYDLPCLHVHSDPGLLICLKGMAAIISNG